MSSKIDNPKIQALVFLVCIFIVSAIIWPLFDLFWCGVITHNEFKYTVNDYLIEPIIISIIATLIIYIPIFIRNRKESKKTKKSK